MGQASYGESLASSRRQRKDQLSLGFRSKLGRLVLSKRLGGFFLPAGGGKRIIWGAERDLPSFPFFFLNFILFLNFT